MQVAKIMERTTNTYGITHFTLYRCLLVFLIHVNLLLQLGGVCLAHAEDVKWLKMAKNRQRLSCSKSKSKTL